MLQDAEVTPIAIVTGASRGIGRLFATALADDGFRVIAVARPSADLESLATVDGIMPAAADVADPRRLAEGLSRAVGELGAPSLLVAAAGSIGALGPIAEVDPDEWWDAVSVDLRGTMLTVRTVLPFMLAGGSGRIVTVYGNLGDDGRRHVSAFAAAKAGIARFTETLAAELAGTGVVALGMHPGFVRTAMTEHLASSDPGRRWLPEFGPVAADRWGDGARAVDLLRRIVVGEADGLAGRIVHVGDDLAALTDAAAADPGMRRLRLGWE